MARRAAGRGRRNSRIPRPFAWLGLISYSVYLLHPLLVEAYRRIPLTRHPHPFPEQVLLAAGFLVVLLGCCGLTHRFIEVPMQRQGRKFAAWLENWFGPDSIPAHHQASLRHVPATCRGAAAAPEPRRPLPDLPGLPG